MELINEKRIGLKKTSSPLWNIFLNQNQNMTKGVFQFSHMHSHLLQGCTLFLWHPLLESGAWTCPGQNKRHRTNPTRHWWMGWDSSTSIQIIFLPLGFQFVTSCLNTLEPDVFQTIEHGCSDSVELIMNKLRLRKLSDLFRILKGNLRNGTYRFHYMDILTHD